MKWPSIAFLCVALTGSGCLHQVAPLVGHSDGGVVADDGGPGGGDGGDAGSVVEDGGADGGAGGSDGGLACDWRAVADAGVCSDDSQCASGFYCDVTVTACPDSDLSTVNPARCLPICPITGALNVPGGPCTVNEDCAPQEFCSCDDAPGAIQPCDAGHCVLYFGDLLCTTSLPLPAGCQGVGLPHSPVEACLCIGNTCTAPSACAVEGGTPCDGGVCIDGGCQLPEVPLTP